MSSTQYLFLFTIGPVQSFIAQARKTRDLYAGSAILGDIIQAAMRKTREKNGEIIVPDYNQGAKPNRFLAMINSEEIQGFGVEIENAAQKEWKRIASSSLGNATIGDKFFKKMSVEFLPQIENFLEIYWAAIPYDENINYYHKTNKELQKLLGAVKNIRQFSQIEEQAKRKCSLDGERNALFYRPSANGRIPYIHPDANPIHKSLLPGEALSAVSLVKRFYQNTKDKHEFPSTAEIALIKVINEDNLNEKNYKKYFEGKFDYQCCYEENLTEEAFKKSEIKLSTKYTFSDVQQACITLTQKKKTKYYALLVFDGDNMGKIWSGEGFSDLEQMANNQLKTFQQQLSIRLGIHARYAKALINGNIPLIEDAIYNNYIQEVNECKENNSSVTCKSRIKFFDISKGKVVYAGGDDFLAFVNLNYLFDVMKELREAYSALVEVPIKQEFQGFSGCLTFTAGVAIAHYKEPLSIVLSEARAAEKSAKKAFENDYKNAFSLTVLKHSGESLRCMFKWKYNEDYLTDALDYVVKKRHDENGFSNTFIKNIDREFRALLDNEQKYSEDEMIESEIKRLLTRSAMAKSKEKREKETIDMIPFIMKLYKNLDRTNILNLLSALHICDFIKMKTSDEYNN